MGCSLGETLAGKVSSSTNTNRTFLFLSSFTKAIMSDRYRTGDGANTYMSDSEDEEGGSGRKGRRDRANHGRKEEEDAMDTA